jgi:uncharacterized repeat protein (TIGR03943 family)
MNRLDTLLKSALLAGLALMFYAKLGDGTLAYYINQRFAWLALVAAVLLAGLALTLLHRVLTARRIPSPGASVDVDVDHPHPHPHAHSPAWPALVLLALPLALGLLVPARPLGASAVAARGIGVTAPGVAGGGAQRTLSGPRDILDWLREFGRAPDPAAFAGQPVDVVGFVYRDSRNAADQFWVSRFAVSCCAADAAAVGLLVQSELAPGLKSDAWVRVTGTMSVGAFDGEAMPVIAAQAIEPTAQPEQPYLYP